MDFDLAARTIPAAGNRDALESPHGSPSRTLPHSANRVITWWCRNPYSETQVVVECQPPPNPAIRALMERPLPECVGEANRMPFEALAASLTSEMQRQLRESDLQLASISAIVLQLKVKKLSPHLYDRIVTHCYKAQCEDKEQYPGLDELASFSEARLAFVPPEVAKAEDHKLAAQFPLFKAALWGYCSRSPIPPRVEAVVDAFPFAKMLSKRMIRRLIGLATTGNSECEDPKSWINTSRFKPPDIDISVVNPEMAQHRRSYQKHRRWKARQGQHRAGNSEEQQQDHHLSGCASHRTSDSDRTRLSSIWVEGSPTRPSSSAAMGRSFVHSSISSIPEANASFQSHRAHDDSFHPTQGYSSQRTGSHHTPSSREHIREDSGSFRSNPRQYSAHVSPTAVG